MAPRRATAHRDARVQRVRRSGVPRHRRVAFRLGWIALVVGSISLIPLAWGDFYATGDGSAGWLPDNDEHTYCFANDYTGENPRDAANGKMENLDQQTDMSDNKVPACNDATDAKFHIADLVGFDGFWTCLDLDPDVCRSYRLQFDREAITSKNDWLQTTCHEIGHSAGLGHGNESDCLGTRNDEHQFRIYDGHHVGHINAVFP